MSEGFDRNLADHFYLKNKIWRLIVNFAFLEVLIVVCVPIIRPGLRDGFCHSCLSDSRRVLLFMNDGSLLAPMLLVCGRL